MDTKQKVVTKDIFGKCPICGKPLLLLQTYYALYTLTDNAWINRMLADKTKYKVKCESCGYTCEMKVVPEGLVPINFKNKLKSNPILLNNPIGTYPIEEEDIDVTSK
jgi:transcription elongation factor Elf1